MVNFYNSDTYRILKNNINKHHFRLLSETVGVLIIFGDNFIPQCILIESWNKDLNQFSSEENDAIQIAKTICGKINLPFYFLKYSDDMINNQSQIIYYTSQDVNAPYDTTNLYDFFTKCIHNNSVNFTILDKEKRVAKEINDKASTPFHIWQRKYLQYDGFPIDIDMVYYDTDIRAIIELKRSYIQNWKPYKFDEKNYLSICKLCNLLEINFLLFFIPQLKNNGRTVDDYEHIRIYDIYHKIGNYQNSDDVFFCQKYKISLNDLIQHNHFRFLSIPQHNDTWTPRQ